MLTRLLNPRVAQHKNNVRFKWSLRRQLSFNNIILKAAPEQGDLFGFSLLIYWDVMQQIRRSLNSDTSVLLNALMYMNGPSPKMLIKNINTHKLIYYIKVEKTRFFCFIIVLDTQMDSLPINKNSIIIFVPFLTL